MKAKQMSDLYKVIGHKLVYVEVAYLVVASNANEAEKAVHANKHVDAVFTESKQMDAPQPVVIKYVGSVSHKDACETFIIVPPVKNKTRG